MGKREQVEIERRKRTQFLERVATVYDVSRTDAERLFSTRLRSSARVNRLHEAPHDETVRALTSGWEVEPIAWCPDAYFLHGDKRSLAQSELFQDGRVFLQNASSFVPVVALDAQPGDHVFDAAAAPGGKASHIASNLRNDCHLWLNDPLKPRVDKLREMMTLLRVRVEQVTSHPGQYVDKFVDATFDRVLVDAQCSGEGRVDLTRPRALEHWSTKRIVEYGRLQQRMLVAAFRLLRPGGVLVYSTCTVAPEENEAPVDNLVRHHDAVLEPVDLDLEARVPAVRAWDGRTFSPTMRNAVRLRPTPFMEAFFVARITRPT